MGSRNARAEGRGGRARRAGRRGHVLRRRASWQRMVSPICSSGLGSTARPGPSSGDHTGTVVARPPARARAHSRICGAAVSAMGTALKVAAP
eukprot:4391965-Prymnesium_polylepis.1